MLAAVQIHFELPQSFLDTRSGREGFVLLAAFLGSFLFIRTSARLMRSPKVPWWPGSVTTESGLHLHHLVWGIVLILLSGFLSIATDPQSPWSEILAAGFGIGAGFTLDEFALWVRLEDVYWAQEGRASLDAVVVAAVLGGLVVLGLAPFDASDPTADLSLALVVAVELLLVVFVIIKGKPLVALIGVFIPPVAVVGALRLASPRSMWARWRYRAGSRKLARSEARFARAHARHVRALNALGGAPESAAAAAGGAGGVNTPPAAVQTDAPEES